MPGSRPDGCLPRAASWKNSSKCRVRAAIMSVIMFRPTPASPCRRPPGPTHAGPPGEEVDPDGTNERLCERIVDQGIVDVGAIALAAATMVAVAPTLDARFQLSLSVRATSSPSISTSCLATST